MKASPTAGGPLRGSVGTSGTTKSVEGSAAPKAVITSAVRLTTPAPSSCPSALPTSHQMQNIAPAGSEIVPPWKAV